MYLLLSIAAADLCGSCALIFEGWYLDNFVWFTWKRVFGAFMLGTFFLLVGASIRVLFYTSVENVELVLGAAAVLFIADVVSEGTRHVRGGDDVHCCLHDWLRTTFLAVARCRLPDSMPWYTPDICAVSPDFITHGRFCFSLHVVLASRQLDPVQQW